MPRRQKVTQGLMVQYDRPSKELSIRFSGEGEKKIFEFRFEDADALDSENVERTLGQIILYSLNKITRGGLGFGEYDSLLDKIADENFESLKDGLNVNDPDDQYALATFLFSRGRKKASWSDIENAEKLFERAANAGHAEARRFLVEDLPVVRSRLEERLKKPK
jgi:hypothetical protein